jgi:hypothetical protein
MIGGAPLPAQHIRIRLGQREKVSKQIIRQRIIREPLIAHPDGFKIELFFVNIAGYCPERPVQHVASFPCNPSSRSRASR